MSTNIRFPQGPIIDLSTGYISLEWSEWLLNPQVVSISLGNAIAVGSGGTGLTSGTSGGVLAFTATDTLASSGVLNAGAMVLGGGVGATPSTPVGLGTIVTVLHGNAAGNPSWGAVSLTADVSGILPLGFGGTNANLTASLGGIFYSTATAGAILSGTASAGKILRSGASAAPAWSTATFPATAGTAANVLRSDGTNFLSVALSAADLSNGTTGTGPVMLSASPTTTGTLTAAAANFSGALTGTTAAFTKLASGDVITFGVSAAKTGYLTSSTPYIALTTAPALAGTGFLLDATSDIMYLRINAANEGILNSTSFALAHALSVGTTLQVGSFGAFAAGDKYVIADAVGHLHISALGPGS